MRRPRRLSKLLLITTNLWTLAVLIPGAQAAQVLSPGGKIPTCATVERLAGGAQVLDEDRSKLEDVSPHMAIACGSWMTVLSGWLTLKHRDGYEFRAPTGTFFQLVGKGSGTGDEQVILMKGQLLAEAGEGSPELKLLTSNARARIKEGKAIVVFDSSSDETQLFVLEKRASLENRFIEPKPVDAKAGEATSLNFKTLRVMPTTPRVASQASVKQKLSEFYLEPEAQARILVAMSRRADRKFASVLPRPALGEESADGPSRAPAAFRKEPVKKAAPTAKNKVFHAQEREDGEADEQSAPIREKELLKERTRLLEELRKLKPE